MLKSGKNVPVQTSWTNRQISRLLIGLLAVPLGGTAFAQQATPPPPTVPAATEPAPQQLASSSSLLPDALGLTMPDAPAPQNTPPPANNQNGQAAPQSQQQSTPQQPLGTAAAPYEQPSGITASRPAGAAIAPAKQRRTRTILISVGVLVAGAIALGTVMALSKASPSTAH